MQLLAADVIVALATPPGRSALALIRLSGSDAFAVAERVLAPWHGCDRVSELTRVRHPLTGEIIDRGLVTTFIAPRSYTGENLLELTVHGGAVVPLLVLAALVAAGARQALPGEFTRRAVLHGKLDIVQAEGIADLVDARTRTAHKVALRQVDGLLSSRLSSLRDAVLNVEALIAYDVDFPEEDEGPLSGRCVEVAVDRVLEELTYLLAHASRGEISRGGAAVVIAGPSNVGKSTLFNALLGEARALVSDVPGTTRDALEAEIELAEVPVRLVDTAGRRDTGDYVEQLGVALTDRWLGAADVVVACGDDGIDATVVAQELTEIAPGSVIPVQLKADLVLSSALSAPLIVAECEHIAPGQRPLLVSARTGYGLNALIDKVVSTVRDGAGSVDLDAPLLTRERHRVGIVSALQEIRSFQELWRGGHVPAVVAGAHLRAAVSALEEIVGLVAPEEVLERVFESFCIGK